MPPGSRMLLRSFSSPTPGSPPTRSSRPLAGAHPECREVEQFRAKTGRRRGAGDHWRHDHHSFPGNLQPRSALLRLTGGSPRLLSHDAVCDGPCEVEETYQQHQEMRREGFGEVLDGLADKGTLRSGFSRDELLDVFLVVYGEATYHLLTFERGWSHDRVMDWLCTELPQLLIQPDED